MLNRYLSGNENSGGQEWKESSEAGKAGEMRIGYSWYFRKRNGDIEFCMET